MNQIQVVKFKEAKAIFDAELERIYPLTCELLEVLGKTFEFDVKETLKIMERYNAIYTRQ